MHFIPIINILIILVLCYILFIKILDNKNLFKISIGFSLFYFILTLIIYFNNLSHGFDSGILYGNIANAHFCDEFRYFEDSKILYSHFINDGFKPWFNRSLPPWEFIDIDGHPGFGNYNIFVVFLSLLRLIGFKTVLDFITLKLIFYPISIFFLYKLFKIYLDEKYSLISLIIFSILPGYILNNTLLMRDNIILFLVIVCFYIIFSQNLNLKYKTIALIPLLLCLLIFRAYLAPIFIATIIFCYKNSKKIFSFRDGLFFIVIIFTLVFFTTFKFNNGELMIFGGFSDEQIRILQEEFTIRYGSGLMTPLKVFYLTLLHIFYVPPFLNFWSTNIIYLILFSMGNIFSVVTSLFFIPSYFYLAIKNRNENIIYLLKFTFYFTFLCGLILVSKDGFIITRLSLMWTPLFFIIITKIFSR
ncbi:MAG: hypothetical protein E6940_07455 [Clostridium septicum]|uniref:hypothetical protein n=1 Tax=Clostridium septicum TaxID=1504 RepID=UPI002583B56F|nr:hypothetical protein [Clostridium septicum]MDU1313884.1 hypothetical protein [Clostridium septicum]